MSYNVNLAIERFRFVTSSGIDSIGALGFLFNFLGFLGFGSSNAKTLNTLLGDSALTRTSYEAGV